MTRWIASLLMACCLPCPAGATEISTRQSDIEGQKERLEALISRFGGEEGLEKTLAPFKEVVTARVKAHQGDRSTMRVGDMIYNSEICKAAILSSWTNPHVAGGRGTDPFESIVEFSRELRKISVDLIVIPVPSKIEAYPENFGASLPPGIPVSLGRTRFMLDLLKEGVEVLDVLPDVVAQIPDAEMPLYETSYHHHSGLGARVIGEVVAKRLKRYSFAASDSNRYKDVKRKTHERHHPDVPMWAWQVIAEDGKPYAHVSNSPVVVIGDSNAFAHGAASWTSHIARSLGIPISEIARGGGGPTAHARLAERGAAALQARRVVVWIVTSSHIQRHPWRKASIRPEASVTALVELGKFDEAAKRIQESRKTGAESIDLDESVVDDLGKEFLAGEDYESAIKVFELSTLAFPDSAAAFESLGAAYRGSGDDRRAADGYLRSIELNPFNRKVTRTLGEMGLDHEIPSPPKLTEEQIGAVVGTYGLDHEQTLSVTRDGEDLFVKFSNNRRMNLVATTPRRFVTRNGFSFRFLLDDSQERATAVKIRLGSRRLVADRAQ